MREALFANESCYDRNKCSQSVSHALMVQMWHIVTHAFDEQANVKQSNGPLAMSCSGV